MHELDTFVKHIENQFLERCRSPEDKVQVLRRLSKKLGLEHHLRPECIAVTFDKAPLPDTAPELYRNRADKSEKIAAFLKRVYRPWIGQGLTRNHLRHLDKSAYWAFKNHIAYHKELPDVDLPRKGDLIDHDFELLSAFDDPASRQQLDDEIVALRRIENFLASRSSTD